MPARALERLTLKSNDRLSIVNLTDVDWISAADNYVAVHVATATHLLRSTISALLARLPPNRFARISRSVIVNLDRIAQVENSTHGDGIVQLRDGTRLTLSRTRRDGVVRYLLPFTRGR